VWEIEVADPAVSVREFVYVDAHNGKVVDQITGIHETLTREVSEGSLANVVWQEGDPDPIPGGWAGGSSQQVSAWQDEIDGARETYNVFGSLSSGACLSYDCASAKMRTVNNAPISCPNANWNGVSTNYCNGVTGDDTVAHEWGHAYDEFSSNLIYQWQAGALDESFSDIWGEVVDFLNGRGTDSPGHPREDGTCSSLGIIPPPPQPHDNSYRWLSGEDDPAFILGPIRDLWNPNCLGDPGKVSDSQYHCTTTDGGGVHTNSGVPNHAFALLVDGGTYNGQTVSGIGLNKGTHLYRAAQLMLTPTSNFADQADALEGACSALIGSALPTIVATDPPWSGTGSAITAANCTQVGKAIQAVELRTEPTQCGFEPLLDADPPDLCGGGLFVHTISRTDWESGLGNWSAGTRAVANPATFDTPDWAVVGDLPDERAGNAAFVIDDRALGDCQEDDESGVLYLQSPEITIPVTAEELRLVFDHWVATEAGWDGGNLRIRVNGGSWQLLQPGAFVFNAYNANLQSAPDNTNPLEDRLLGAISAALGRAGGPRRHDPAAIRNGAGRLQRPCRLVCRRRRGLLLQRGSSGPQHRRDSQRAVVAPAGRYAGPPRADDRQRRWTGSRLERCRGPCGLRGPGGCSLAECVADRGNDGWRNRDGGGGHYGCHGLGAR
jgi:hypothetical protein